MVEEVKLEDEERKLEAQQQKNKKRSPGGGGKGWNFKWRHIIGITILLLIGINILYGISYSMAPKIAVVPLKGTLMTESSTSLLSGTSLSSRQIASTIRSLGEDGSVKAILLDINSGGGSPVATAEISKAVEEVSKSKPVYGLINDVGASGAFWVAMSTNKTYASPMSTLGSIGVTSVGLGFEDFIREYNITYRKQTAGELKDMGTPFREVSEEEEQIIQNILDDLHERFISHVAESRNMSVEEVRPYADGRIFLGSTAKEAGFIDELGYYPDVIAELKNQTGDVLVTTHGPTPGIAEQLGLNLFSEHQEPGLRFES